MDPLTVRELTGLSRRWQVYLSRGLYVASVGLAIYLWWSFHLARIRWASPSEFANLGRQLFISLFVLQMILVTIGTTMGASDMLGKEVRSKTLALLFLTPLSGFQIALSKFKAAMVQGMTLMLCGIPVLAICSYLGAIGVEEMIWSTSLTLAFATLGASLGLRQAVLCRTAGGATMMALSQLGSSFFVLLPVARMFEPVEFLLAFLHPAGAILGATRVWPVGGWGPYGWISATICSVAFSLWLVRRTGKSLFELSSRIEEPDPDLTEDRGLLTAGAAVRSWITETRVWDEEPLLWKELVTRPGVRTEPYLGKPLFGISLAVLVLMWLGTGGISMPFLLLVECLVLISLVVLGSSLFVRDRETRWSELIRCSPLTSFQLLRAKLMAGLIAPESLYVLAIGAVVLIGWTVRLGILPSLFSILMTSVFFLFAYLVAAFSSLHSGSIRRAFICAAALLAVIFLAFPYQSVWLEPNTLFGGGRFSALRVYLSTLNPVIFLDAGDRAQWNPVQVGKPFIALVSFVGTYAGASSLLMGMIAWTFHRMRSRN